MERFVLLLSLILLPQIPLNARLGETPIQFVDRYGPHQRIPYITPLLKNADIRIYKKNGWVITAAFLNIDSGALRVTYRKETNIRLSEEEVKELLQANANNATWKRAVIPKDLEQRKALEKVSISLFRAILGGAVWIRTDGATAQLMTPDLMQFDLLDAYVHEKQIDANKVNKDRETRPGF